MDREAKRQAQPGRSNPPANRKGSLSMKSWLKGLSAAVCLLVVAPALASGKIYYGSRAGMTVSVLSVTGLDTSHAVIRTKHAREDAVAFCRDYVQKVSDECINRELAVPMNDFVEANCSTGEFVDFFGSHHRFEGSLKKQAELQMAEYVIRDMATGKIADGSSASGYPVNIGIFHALCPMVAPDVQ
jgi:hypothetical protein